ncbi:DUF4158 domain-containing protein [Streptomyces sp. NPDC006553]|uniref:DUF4158 domain-containing protein n=1 Tax=Streptomyces sp. NPDC006553 TaxID=3157180 RepID=UPI0033BAFD72
MDARARELVPGKRWDATKLGWAVQWGTVRMLGTFLLDDPVAVTAPVVAFVAEQLRLDAACLAEYTVRPKTANEHTWEICDVYGYLEFSAAEAEVRQFVAARVWASLEGPRALFDRAVVWLVDNRVLLPGITTLTRLVAEVRAEPLRHRLRAVGTPGQEERPHHPVRHARCTSARFTKVKLLRVLAPADSGPGQRCGWWSCRTIGPNHAPVRQPRGAALYAAGPGPAPASAGRHFRPRTMKFTVPEEETALGEHGGGPTGTVRGSILRALGVVLAKSSRRA